MTASVNASAHRRILVIDDDQDIQDFLSLKLGEEGYAVTAVGAVKEGIDLLGQPGGKFDLILSDLRMPEEGGMELLSTLREKGYDLPVILITAHGSVEAAVDAMRGGAHDFVLKPIHLNELKLSIERALRYKQLEADNVVLRSELKKEWKFAEIIGKSHSIRSVFELIQRVAPTQANVLITGESGTGKELVARALHRNSPRIDKPFVAINCSAIPGELLESELFGHVKGSFTGAHAARKGLFEEAEGGTIFLDEIGDMELALQAKLLRVIQERKIKMVGDNKMRDIDVRIVAATHKDLRAAVKAGRFREDLFYRLCVIPIEIPPLRARREDIPLLAEHFLRKHIANHGLQLSGISPDAMSKLVNHAWDGNVRELENVIERSSILARGRQLTGDDIPDFAMAPAGGGFLEERSGDFMTLKEIEKQYIGLILRKTGGKKERAAHILGIDRKTLYRKEREYGLSVEKARAGEAGAAGENGADDLEAHEVTGRGEMPTGLPSDNVRDLPPASNLAQ